MQFKTDFEEVAARWDAYWAGESQPRPLVAVLAPKAGVEPVAHPKWIRNLDDDVEPVIDELLAWANSHEFLGEAIPFHAVFFGPDHLAALLGGDLVRHADSPETTWPVHTVSDWDQADLSVRWEGRWWEMTVDRIRRFRRRCDGRVLISMPTLQGGMDCLVAMRGVQELMMDLVERPESVASALRRVEESYRQVTEALSSELDVSGFGTINRHGMYCRGATNVIQCDVSCMLSGEMFREFCLPSIAFEAGVLSAANYHLDGPGAIRHLEDICGVAGISAIQWQPGAGQAAQQDWTDLYLKIDSLGMGHTIFLPIDQIEPLARQLTSRRVYFQTFAASRDDATRLLEKLRSR